MASSSGSTDAGNTLSFSYHLRDVFLLGGLKVVHEEKGSKLRVTAKFGDVTLRSHGFPIASMSDLNPLHVPLNKKGKVDINLSAPKKIAGDVILELWHDRPAPSVASLLGTTKVDLMTVATGAVDHILKVELNSAKTKTDEDGVYFHFSLLFAQITTLKFAFARLQLADVEQACRAKKKKKEDDPNCTCRPYVKMRFNDDKAHTVKTSVKKGNKVTWIDLPPLSLRCTLAGFVDSSLMMYIKHEGSRGSISLGVVRLRMRQTHTAADAAAVSGFALTHTSTGVRARGMAKVEGTPIFAQLVQKDPAAGPCVHTKSGIWNGQKLRAHCVEPVQELKQAELARVSTGSAPSESAPKVSIADAEGVDKSTVSPEGSRTHRSLADIRAPRVVAPEDGILVDLFATESGFIREHAASSSEPALVPTTSIMFVGEPDWSEEEE